MEFTAEAEARMLAQFGKTELRTGQRQLIELVLAGQNALGVLPTGHGKSLCYQAAAELLGGTTLVVSPLIALMRDQCEALRALGISAARFDSTLEPEERGRVLADLRNGELRILFVAPESVENRELRQTLAAATLSLLVVDEAHCAGNIIEQNTVTSHNVKVHRTELLIVIQNIGNAVHGHRSFSGTGHPLHNQVCSR